MLAERCARVRAYEHAREAARNGRLVVERFEMIYNKSVGVVVVVAVKSLRAKRRTSSASLRGESLALAAAVDTLLIAFVSF